MAMPAFAARRGVAPRGAASGAALFPYPATLPIIHWPNTQNRVKLAA
jgi:hypothetical protein